MKLPTLKIWRTLLPAAAPAVFVLLFARHSYPLPPDSPLLLWYSRLDPLLLLHALRWDGAFPAWGWLAVAAVALTALAGRLFCGWLCPLGGLLALLHSLRAAVLPKSRVPAWTVRLLPWRFPWLLAVLAVLLLTSGWALFLSPFHLLTEELSRLWQGRFPWLLAFIAALGLVAYPRFWCVYLCPTGLLLSFAARWRRVTVRPPVDCIGCVLCTRVCPTGAAHPWPQPAGPDCLVCGRCSQHCPVGRFDISGASADRPVPAATGASFTRREIIRAGVALTVAAAAAPALARPSGANPLRPPGALDEDEFLARCSRCGRCIKTCPAQCLTAMPLSSGAALFLTPVITPRAARCELTQDCQKVCPTGAIAHLPVEKALIGLAEIDRTRCIGWAEGRLCLLCQEQCPLHAIDSDDKDRPSVIAANCVGCGACENGCPLDDAAIVVKAQPTRRRA